MQLLLRLLNRLYRQTDPFHFHCRPFQISGHGLALAGVTIEQDAAYWEVHVTSSGSDERLDVLVGLATKKDKKYFEATTDDTIDLDNTDDEYRKKSGIEFMSKIPVSNNDVIGIVVQQSDLPMIQFYLNGTQQYYASINRFRGSIYPSFYIPSSCNNNVTLKVAFLEHDFRQSIPNHSCSPVMVARGLM
jgi:SPRY domain